MANEFEGRLGRPVDLAAAPDKVRTWLVDHQNQIRAGMKLVLADAQKPLDQQVILPQAQVRLGPSGNTLHSQWRTGAYDGLRPELRPEAFALLVLPDGTVQDRAGLMKVVGLLIEAAHPYRTWQVASWETQMGEELPYYGRLSPAEGKPYESLLDFLVRIAEKAGLSPDQPDQSQSNYIKSEQS